MRDHLGNPFFSGRPEFARGVLLMDDCEGALTWTKSGTAGDSTLSLDAEAAFYGATGMKLVSRTTGAAAGDTIQAYKGVDIPESGLLVFRAKIRCPNTARLDKIDLSAAVYIGATYKEAVLRWDEQLGKLQYKDDTGAFVDLMTGGPNAYQGTWTTMELMIDTRAFRYIRARYNGQVYDLDGINLLSAAAANLRQCLLRITASTETAFPVTLHADCIYAGEYEDL